MVSRQMGHWPKLQAVSTLLLAAAIASALILKGPLSTRAPQKNPWTVCLKTLLQLCVAGRSYLLLYPWHPKQIARHFSHSGPNLSHLPSCPPRRIPHPSGAQRQRRAPSPGQIPWQPSARKCNEDHTPRPPCRSEGPEHPCGGLFSGRTNGRVRMGDVWVKDDVYSYTVYVYIYIHIHHIIYAYTHAYAHIYIYIYYTYTYTYA